MSNAEISSYHAHIYYEPGRTRDRAEQLREAMAQRFSVQLGRWHDVPVGPHPQAMYQVAFAAEVFARFVPWLMLNRIGLTILVHPNTGRPRDDHLEHACWMGAVLPLKGSVLPEAEDSVSAVQPNTQPSMP